MVISYDIYETRRRPGSFKKISYELTTSKILYIYIHLSKYKQTMDTEMGLARQLRHHKLNLFFVFFILGQEWTGGSENV